jgi:hypothetical protein
MNLREATSWLLHVPDPATQLRLADNYIQTYNKLPTKFILPAAHGKLQPIIEAFANDVNGFVDYIRALRDASEGGAYDELHELYRTISVRALQQTRRARITKALSLLGEALEKKLGRELTAENRVVVTSYIEKMWGAMRLEYMALEREQRRSERLTSEDRGLVLDEFWKKIEAELANGRVPVSSPDDVDKLAERLK